VLALVVSIHPGIEIFNIENFRKKIEPGIFRSIITNTPGGLLRQN
jgi:hypothetical protein